MTVSRLLFGVAAGCLALAALVSAGVISGPSLVTLVLISATLVVSAWAVG